MHTHGSLQFLDAMTETDNSMELSGRKSTSTQVLIRNYCPDMSISVKDSTAFHQMWKNLQELRRATVSCKIIIPQRGSVL